MNNKLLIHAPLLSTPGGKQTYYNAIRKHFNCRIAFFFYGSKGKEETFIASSLRLFRDYYKFYRAAKTNDVDMVLLNPSLNPKSFLRDFVFALICVAINKPMVVFWRGWNWDFERKFVSKIKPFFRLTYGQAAAMIVLASDFRDHLRAYGFKRNIYLETTTVDDVILNFHIDNTLRNSRPIPAYKKEITLLFLARIEKNKGIYETLDSFSDLSKRYSNLRLIIAGTGGELQLAQDYACNNHIKNVEFVGWITGNEKARILNKSDIYVFPSFHGEGMPNSLLEAMASGLTIVTTNVGGIKDFFEPGKMGEYVNSQDTSDLTIKLEKIIDNQDRLPVISHYNSEYARQRFAPSKVAKRLEKIYYATTGNKTKIRKVTLPITVEP